MYQINLSIFLIEKIKYNSTSSAMIFMVFFSMMKNRPRYIERDWDFENFDILSLSVHLYKCMGSFLDLFQLIS